MACEDCENKFPDRTVDKNCSDGINDAILGKVADAAVGPVTPSGRIGTEAISYVSNAVRNVSKRFGKVQPGIYLTDEQALSLNKEVGVIFDDLLMIVKIFLMGLNWNLRLEWIISIRLDSPHS